MIKRKNRNLAPIRELMKKHLRRKISTELYSDNTNYEVLVFNQLTKKFLSLFHKSIAGDSVLLRAANLEDHVGILKTICEY